jgi:hypothetical protein
VIFEKNNVKTERFIFALIYRFFRPWYLVASLWACLQQNIMEAVVCGQGGCSNHGIPEVKRLEGAGY